MTSAPRRCALLRYAIHHYAPRRTASQRNEFQNGNTKMTSVQILRKSAPSVDRRLLEQVLRKTQMGKHLTYADLTAVVGRDIKIPGAWAALSAARRGLEKEKVVFSCDRGLGLRRLTDEEIAVVDTAKNRKAIARKSKRSARRANGANLFSLSAQDQLTVVLAKSLFIATAALVSTRTSNKLATLLKAEGAADLPLRRLYKELASIAPDRGKRQK